LKKITIDTSKYVCLNKECKKYKKANDDGYIRFYSIEGKNKDIIYLKCTCCGRRFSERKGTIFFNKKSSPEEIVQALKATSEGTGIRATARIFKKDKDTILSWVKQAGKHTAGVENFFSRFKTKRGSNR
jgi:stress response protein SCP2